MCNKPLDLKELLDIATHENPSNALMQELVLLAFDAGKIKQTSENEEVKQPYLSGSSPLNDGLGMRLYEYDVLDLAGLVDRLVRWRRLNMREIVGAMINGRTITNNLNKIILAANTGNLNAVYDQKQMQLMSDLDLGSNWDLMASGQTLFIICSDGTMQWPNAKLTGRTNDDN